MIKNKYKIIKKEIFIKLVWKLMHKIIYLLKYPKINLTNSVPTEKSLISLPSHPNL